MKIYTGYFAQMKKYKEHNLFPIAITRYTPNWFEGFTESIFAPSISLLQEYKMGIITEEEYEQRYTAELDSHKSQVEKSLQSVSKMVTGNDAILLCYEKSTDFCHRHLLAKYAKQNFNIDIEEFVLE